MDTLAHALYGATLCSRTGLAGGRSGPPRGTPFSRDWTVWVAAGFGLLPDMASIGVTFAHMMIRGETISFHHLPPFLYVLYHTTHSLLVAGLCVLILRAVAPRLAVCSLAWPLHILMDSVSHDDGWWQTLLFYPVSDWHYQGVNWWEHPNLILSYWGCLPVLWLGLRLWRRRCAPPASP